MNLISYTIVKAKHGPDYVFINTDLPSSEFPFTGTLTLKFSCAANTGEQYMQKHFPNIKGTIINDN